MTQLNRTAKIKRHGRIQKEHLNNKQIFKWLARVGGENRLNYWLLFVVIILVPLYPSFSNVGAASEFDFDRQYINEDSIIESFLDDGSDDQAPIVESKNSFISINTIIDAPRDLSGTNEIVDYEIQSGDSISSIAYKFNVSNNSIYWANDMTKKNVIRPWDVIKIPPVSGVVHVIQSGDTLWAIAQKYDTSEEKIKSQNLISDSSWLIAGKRLVIPWAIKVYEAPKPKVQPSSPTKAVAKATTTDGYSFAAKAQSQYVNSGWKYNLVYRKPYSGAAGNCTWYVASYKWVNWRGNANQWMRNARAKWHPTGSTPTLWAIVQFEWRWYNPYYGHVAIVMDVTDSHIIVSDMNYRRKYEVTTRKVPRNDRSIQWYIYVN